MGEVYSPIRVAAGVKRSADKRRRDHGAHAEKNITSIYFPIQNGISVKNMAGGSNGTGGGKERVRREFEAKKVRHEYGHRHDRPHCLLGAEWLITADKELLNRM